MTSNSSPQELFGGIDIYIFDLLLKGRLNPDAPLLDAGCGAGRNLTYFFRSGYDVFGVDQSTSAIDQVRALAAILAPQLPSNNFRVEPVEKMSFADSSFGIVVSSAVLHFARDEAHWQSMVKEMWRVVKPGGIFFARTASTVGIETQIQQIEGRRYHLPDGTERFLVDELLLSTTTADLGGELVEPFKTVLVHGMRSMSNWCLLKP